ncbi:NADP-dependent phosphogluconate dehydrogenase [uncultured Ferrimonas sp.]|uniref:NADP-dependent phosphogluconate dehydrogenase n=1 Tax=uncultured Ferrimonas sp. TaxID=432640 RepID=UPI002610E6BC|nr:NADP-dependent phosphogluconate dehydrogenase [uncultured Ferrimonas sp.]
MPTATVSLAIIGQGVMGQNLALNFASHGINLSVFDLNPNHVEHSVALSQSLDGTILGADSLCDLLTQLPPPRAIVLSLPAGNAIDASCDALLEAGLDREDLVIDSGNCHWDDTLARQQRYQGKLRFLASAISGGEVGARHGPSLMISGSFLAWQQIAPLWHTIAAKADNRNGQPLPTVSDNPNAVPCAGYVGPDGSGHFVKTIHNGIEYAQMQLWAEAYQLLKQHGQMSNNAIAALFKQWQLGPLQSYLLDCTIAVLEAIDEVTDTPLLPLIVDAAGQKGTGTWTAKASLALGVAAPSVHSAVAARAISSQKALRQQLSQQLASSSQAALSAVELQGLHSALEQALLGATLINYAQGFEVIASQAQQQQWPLDLAAIAQLWRAGCIIRTPLLQTMAQALACDPDAHLLEDRKIQQRLNPTLPLWRRTLLAGISAGVALPVFSSALAYVDGLRCADSPANLLQGMRDHFGGHRFRRYDDPSGALHHHPWPR